MARLVPARATPDGTETWCEKQARVGRVGGFRKAFGLRLATIGLGTYLGEVDAARDAGYREAIQHALQGGINVIDTAINYRNQRSERVIGATLAEGVRSGALDREAVFVATKGGYIPFDADAPDARRDIYEQYVAPGLISEENVVGGVHCMDAPYLRDQIDRSRHNLGLETLDLYYVHNPETQLGSVDQATFYKRLLDAFVALEEGVDAGKIARYGIATWNGLREAPGSRGHIALGDVVEAAAEARRHVGGGEHHFKAVQAPLNLAMPEAMQRPSQRTPGGRLVPLVEACTAHGLAFFASASILQGRLSHGLSADWRAAIGEVGTDAQVALQATRSAPGVTTALVGMSRAAHADEAVSLLATRPPDAAAVWEKPAAASA